MNAGRQANLPSDAVSQSDGCVPRGRRAAATAAPLPHRNVAASAVL